MSSKVKVLIGILVFIIICASFCIGFFVGNSKINRRDLVVNYGETFSEISVNEKSFVRTYNVLNIADSIDGNYLYLTIRQFQVDEVETVKVLKSLASSVEVNKNYEFTFKYTNKKIEDNIKSIFENAMLEDIRETDKTGLEQLQDEI